MKKREEEAERWYLQALYDLKAAKWNKEQKGLRHLWENNVDCL
ncbi:MAG: hypothetical protein R3B44_11025 [Candidatus Brocadiaceae bacterium]